MLRVHVLNVGHGDCIILELHEQDNKTFGLIDSNTVQGVPPALKKLRDLGADALSFVCLTHPHRDHYAGLLQIFKAYQGRIGQFYSCPLAGLVTGRIKALARKYQAVADAQDDPGIRQSALEFAMILQFADKELRPQEKWIECAGEENHLAPPGFHNVSIVTVLPPNVVKGRYLQQISSGRLDVVENVKDNDLSIALRISYGGTKMLLGGDGTSENWLRHRRFQQRRGQSIGSSIVKLPHHGSAHDCDETILENLFDGSASKYGLISANGQSHPSPQVLSWLKSHGVQIYCTNLARSCGARVRRLVNVAGVDPVAGRWLNQVAENSDVVQPCQGDLTIELSPAGQVSVTPEFANICDCRGDLDRLFPI